MLFGSYGVFARLIGPSLGLFTYSWARYLIAAIFVGGYLFIRSQKIKLSGRDARWLIGWVVADTASVILIFSSFNKIDLGVAYFLLYAGIILGGYFLGYILYGERFTRLKVFSALLSLAGLFFMFFSSWKQANIIYLAAAFGAGLAGSFWYTGSNKLRNIPQMQLVFLDAICVSLLSFVGALFYREPLPFRAPLGVWVILLVFALVYIFGVKFTVYGFQKLESHLGNLIMPLEAVFGAIFGFIFFREYLGLAAWLGGLLIFAAALLPNLFVKQKSPSN